jgi:hypothetical protein
MHARILRFIALAFVSSLLLSLLPAQPSVPQSYTLTVSSGLAFEALSANSAVEAKVSRFGPREFVDVTVAPQAGHSRAIHARHWFDLVAHKAYTLDVIQNTCSWMTYTAADMPNMYDPIATPAPSAEELATLNKNIVRRENVNGIAAKLSESSSGQGKSSVWIAANGNYPVKVVMTFPGATQPVVMLEVKELRFEKPPAALLAAPANCTTQAQGEWTAEGMHAHFETNIEAHGSGQVDLKTGKATGDATVKSGSEPR